MRHHINAVFKDQIFGCGDVNAVGEELEMVVGPPPGVVFRVEGDFGGVEEGDVVVANGC
jgi:hypothetical protein